MSSETSSVFRPINPTSLVELDAVRRSSADDVDDAVANAKRAMSGSWSRDSAGRQETLEAWGRALCDHSEELVAALVDETGKLVGEARAEVARGAEALIYNGGLSRYVGGRGGTLPDATEAHLVREPVGVTAFIVPWNWPLLLLLRDLAPGLAAGVSAVVKPAPQTSLITSRVLELGRDAGLPKDVVQLVCGGADVGSALVHHADVRAVAFTGSTDIGRRIAAAAGDGLKRTLLELGGKSASVIFADAELDAAVAQSLSGSVITSGQMCMACTRVLAAREVYTDVLDRIVSGAKELTVGDPKETATRVGPLISRAQSDKVASAVEASRTDGTIVSGGRRVQPEGTAGYFWDLAVVTGLQPSSSVVQRDVFGPVVSVEVFDDEEEALNLANATPFGLASAVWTRDVHRAWRAGRAIQAGTIWINGYNRSYPEMPAGGYRSSGLGRSRGVEGIEGFTEIKHVHFTVDGV